MTVTAILLNTYELKMMIKRQPAQSTYQHAAFFLEPSKNFTINKRRRVEKKSVAKTIETKHLVRYHERTCASSDENV